MKKYISLLLTLCLLLSLTACGAKNEVTNVQPASDQKISTVSLPRKASSGTSAGGARAKAVIAWNEQTGDIRSGQIEAGNGYGYWLIKFDGDLYGKEILLEFYSFLRPERKFESLEELKAEIHRNALQTWQYFHIHGLLP